MAALPIPPAAGRQPARATAGHAQKVSDDLRDVFDAPDAAEAKRLLDRSLDSGEARLPKPVAWAPETVPDCFTVVALPAAHRRRLRTNNALERLNKEPKCRTRVATLFPNAAGCERLVSAVAMEISRDWVSGCAYLNMDVED